MCFTTVPGNAGAVHFAIIQKFKIPIMRAFTLSVLLLACLLCKTFGQQAPDRTKIINDSLYNKTHYLFKDIPAEHWSYVSLFPFAGDTVCVCHFYFFYADTSAANKALAMQINQRVMDSLGVLFNIPELKKVSGSVAAYSLRNFDTLSTRFFIYPGLSMKREPN
jgi:hypothetical protein